jgi:hypothetical protein
MTASNAREHLEHLTLLGLADRTKASEAANAPDYWMGTQLLRELWPESRSEMYVPAPNPCVEVSSGSLSDCEDLPRSPAKAAGLLVGDRGCDPSSDWLRALCSTCPLVIAGPGPSECLA